MKKLLVSTLALLLMLGVTGCSKSNEPKEATQSEEETEKEKFYNGIEDQYKFNPASFLEVTYKGVNHDAVAEVKVKDELSQDIFENETEYMEYKKVLQGLNFHIKENSDGLSNGDIMTITSNISDIAGEELSVNTKDFNVKVEGLKDGQVINVLEDYIEPYYGGGSYGFQINSKDINLLYNVKLSENSFAKKKGDVVSLSYSLPHEENINDTYYFKDLHDTKEFVFEDEGTSLTSSSDLTEEDFKKIDDSALYSFYHSEDFVYDILSDFHLIEYINLYKNIQPEDFYQYQFKLVPINYYDKYEDDNYSVCAHYAIHFFHENEFVDTTQEIKITYSHIRRFKDGISFKKDVSGENFQKFSVHYINRDSLFDGLNLIK